MNIATDMVQAQPIFDSAQIITNFTDDQASCCVTDLSSLCTL